MSSMSSLNIFQVFLWNLSFCRFMPIMQIRYILIKDHFFKSSPLKQLKKIKPNLAGMVLMWSFNIMSDSTDLYSRWVMLQKIEIAYWCFIISQMSSNLNCKLSSSTSLSGFSVKFFFQSIYYANCIFWKITFKTSPLKPLNQI
jgi:hypothetical protein